MVRDSKIMISEAPVSTNMGHSKNQAISFTRRTNKDTGASSQWLTFTSNATRSIPRKEITRPLITPFQMVKQIHHSPPSPAIANAFFKVCVVAACTSNPTTVINYLANERKKTLPFYFSALQDYLSTHFTDNDGQKQQHCISKLSLIGYLLLLGVPNWFCKHIAKNYRNKMRSKNIYDAELIKCFMMDKQVRSYSSIQSEKVCGFVMCYLMLACMHNGRPLPSIDFLNEGAEFIIKEHKHNLIEQCK